MPQLQIIHLMTRPGFRARGRRMVVALRKSLPRPLRLRGGRGIVPRPRQAGLFPHQTHASTTRRRAVGRVAMVGARETMEGEDGPHAVHDGFGAAPGGHQGGEGGKTSGDDG